MMKWMLCVLLLLAPQWAMAFSYTVELTEAELQEKVMGFMPLTRKTLFATVTLTDPKLDLLANTDQVSLLTHIDVTALNGITEKGSLSLVGTPYYDAKKHAFFLKDAQIKSLEIDNLEASYLPSIQVIAQQIIATILATQPIYRLEDDNLKHKLAKSVLKSIVIQDEKLLLVLGL